jgi:hypothetical protein
MASSQMLALDALGAPSPPVTPLPQCAICNSEGSVTSDGCVSSNAVAPGPIHDAPACGWNAVVAGGR